MRAPLQRERRESRIADDAASRTTWSLAGVLHQPESLTFNVFLDDAANPSATVALNTAIGGGTFDGYGFAVVDDTLKFGVLSSLSA